MEKAQTEPWKDKLYPFWNFIGSHENFKENY